MDAVWSRQARLLCGIPQGNGDPDDYAGWFLETADEMVFGEEELMKLFNAGLREPLSRAEIRSLRPLDFDTVWQYAVDQLEYRVLAQPAYSSPLVAIPEGRSLQIGVGGVTTPSSSPSAVSPLPASHRGKHGRRESWDSPSDTSCTELVGPLTASLEPASRIGRQSKKKWHGVRCSPVQSVQSCAAAGVQPGPAAGLPAGD